MIQPGAEVETERPPSRPGRLAMTTIKVASRHPQLTSTRSLDGAKISKMRLRKQGNGPCEDRLNAAPGGRVLPSPGASLDEEFGCDDTHSFVDRHQYSGC